MAQMSEIQHDYEAFLAYSEIDSHAVLSIWSSLKKKGIRITHHTAPDGPFVAGSSAYENMANAVEKSDRTLVYLTEAALNSGFVCLEIMLALEKTQRTGKMCVYFIIEHPPDNEIQKLQFGLLKVIPCIPVDRNIENWEKLLTSTLKESKLLSDILPVGNLAHGQVFSHYCGYLQHILPDLEAEIRNSDWFKSSPRMMCFRYFMLIPFSCNTEIPLEGTDDKTGITIEHACNLAMEIMHAGKLRKYNPTIYKATKDEKSIFFVGEFPKVLHSVYKIKKQGIATVDQRLEANRFYHTMNNLLNHHRNPGCNDKCVLIKYADDKYSCGEVLWPVLEDVERTQNKNPTTENIASRLSSFSFTNERKTTYDASVTCLSKSAADRVVTMELVDFLESSNKKVFTRELNDGCLGELCEARWNIFIMSEDTFTSDILNIELISAMFRCATDKKLQVLPIVNKMNIDQVPDMLKWVTTLSTSYKNYQQIVLQHLEGQVVHMQEKMPAGDVSTGLGWAYLLNYLNIQLGDKTEKGHNFVDRITNLLQDSNMQFGCLPRFYVILPSNGENTDITGGPVSYVGKSDPIVKDQAGTKSRPYFMHMYKYTFPDDKQICFMSEVCTPGFTLNTMATSLPFAGIEQGDNLKKQIRNLGDVIDGRLREQHYKNSIGDFTNCFCLIRYDADKGEVLSDVIGKQIEEDLKYYQLVYANKEPVPME